MAEKNGGHRYMKQNYVTVTLCIAAQHRHFIDCTLFNGTAAWRWTTISVIRIPAISTAEASGALKLFMSAMRLKACSRHTNELNWNDPTPSTDRPSLAAANQSEVQQWCGDQSTCRVGLTRWRFHDEAGGGTDPQIVARLPKFSRPRNCGYPPKFSRILDTLWSSDSQKK